MTHPTAGRPGGYETAGDLAFDAFLTLHRLATVETAARARNCSMNAAKKYLRKRVRKGHLRAYPLARDGRHYYRFSPSRVYRLGLPEKVGKPFRGNQGLLKAYAALLWCVGGEVPRRRFTPRSLDEAYPGTFRPELRDAIYCIDGDSGVNRLTLLRCDYGGADPTRLVKKCFADVRRRLTVPAFETLIRESRFGVTLLTVEPTKADRLRQLFAAHYAEHPETRTHFRVESLPALRAVIGGR